MNAKVCKVCVTVAASPTSLFPSHVVHPAHGKPQVFDVFGRAVWRASECRTPTCNLLQITAT
jgi:hypothetical protein